MNSILIAILCLLLTIPAFGARRPNIEPLIDPFGSTYVLPLDINNEGQIVGQFIGDGFLKTGNEWTPIQYPGTLFTTPKSINDFGVIAGFYVEGAPGGPTHGFIYDNGVYRTVDYPGAAQTILTGINNLGHIVGWAIISPGQFLGFVLTGTEFTRLEFPGLGPAFPIDIANDGTIVGTINGSSSLEPGFRLRAGVWEIIEGTGIIGPPPVNAYNAIVSLSNAGLLTSTIDIVRLGYFLVTKHRTTPLAVEPGQELTGINDKGDLIGYTISQPGVVQGFVSSVKALRARD